MDDIQKTAKNLKQQLVGQIDKLNFADVDRQIDELKQRQQNPDFWKDNQKAQSAMQQLSKLTSRVGPWKALVAEVSDIVELASLGDESVKTDLQKQLASAEVTYNLLKKELLYNGEYDDNDVILSIYAGAGGTDAQDWAQMLERMYLRWAEKSRMKVNIISESSGDEAGIKSATIEISGVLAYGKLQSEHGVHRLVRLSPFNSDNLRQTSFAKIDVLPKIDQPETVAIDDKDLKIDVYRAGGKGGQSVNTTDSAVRITHTPTGITVAIQNERSQLQNKETAMTIIRSRLAQLRLEQHAEKLSDIKGPNEQAAWGNQIRNYVMHPYSMVKDTRTKCETSDVQGVLDGGLSEFITAFVEQKTI